VTSPEEIVKEELKERIVGRRIIDVKVKGCMEGLKVSESSIECDAGSIFLILNDFTVIEIWNSEWGGIRIHETIERIVDDY